MDYAIARDQFRFWHASTMLAASPSSVVKPGPKDWASRGPEKMADQSQFSYSKGRSQDEDTSFGTEDWGQS